MAQLRDKMSSTLLAEGTPLEVAIVAEHIGFDDVAFDDVGGGFDPQAVLDAHRQGQDGLRDALRLPQGRKDIRKGLRAAIDAGAASEARAAALRPDAETALRNVRRRLDA